MRRSLARANKLSDVTSTKHYSRSYRSRGYSAEWDKASADFRRANPLCLGCKAIGKRTPSTVTDHVVPHKGDMALFWNKAMWQPACTHHHNVIKQKLESMFVVGECDITDLWLNSALAIKLTKRSPPIPRTGMDGYPVN